MDIGLIEINAISEITALPEFEIAFAAYDPKIATTLESRVLADALCVRRL